MRRCHNALELIKDFRESKRMFRFQSLLILNFISDIIRMHCPTCLILINIQYS